MRYSNELNIDFHGPFNGSLKFTSHSIDFISTCSDGIDLGLSGTLIYQLDLNWSLKTADEVTRKDVDQNVSSPSNSLVAVLDHVAHFGGYYSANIMNTCCVVPVDEFQFETIEAVMVNENYDDGLVCFGLDKTNQDLNVGLN